MAKRPQPTQITLRRPTYGHLPETAKALAAKAKDLDALRTSVVDAATVGGIIWLSYLFTLFYLAIAAGAVTHKDLFFEHGVKLPFLNVDLPLGAFFALGPALFLLTHLYMLLHFVLLAGKVGAFRTELEAQISDTDSPGTKNAEIRTSLRRQLPSNVLVQFLAGPRDVRQGLMGWMLKFIAWFSLVIGPVLLLVFFQLQFLPYHDEAITWWHRVAVLLDIMLLWCLWPAIARAEPVTFPWQGLRWTAIPLGMLSVVPPLLAFTVITFPGDPWHDFLRTARFSPVNGDPQGWNLTRLHRVLLAGRPDLASRRPNSLFSNVLVLPGLDIIDRGKYDTEAKIEALPETRSLRARNLQGAVLTDAILRHVDFTAANLRNAIFDGADLRRAKFECADRGTNPSSSVERRRTECTRLQGASLDRAQLQGASLVGAELQGASLNFGQLQGASLPHPRLQVASLTRAQLRGASLVGAQILGASLPRAQLQGASLDGVCAWQADVRQVGDSAIARVVAPSLLAKNPPQGESANDCDWSADHLHRLETSLTAEILAGRRREAALARIRKILDPDKPLPDADAMEAAWKTLADNPPPDDVFNKARAAAWQSAGCEAEGAPYVIRGLLRDISRDNPAAWQRTLVATFLDPKTCLAAAKLSDDDKARLIQIRGPEPTPAPPAAQ